MKQLLPLLYLLFSVISSAQVKMREEAPKAILKLSPALYDSTTDLVGASYQALIGQDIFMIDPAPDKGYWGFYPTMEAKYEEMYHADASSGMMRTPKQYLIGRTFKVIESYPLEENASYPQVLLKLMDKNNGEVLYHRYGLTGSVVSTPFILTGYFEKLKQAYIGKVFISNGRQWRMNDIETKLPVDNAKGKQWKCVDVICADDPFRYSIVMKNKNETITHDIFRVSNNNIYDDYEPYTATYQAMIDMLISEYKKWIAEIDHAGIGITKVNTIVTDKTAGIDLLLLNRKDKEIKYIYFTLAVRNRVNDVILRKEVQALGPVTPKGLERFQLGKALTVKMADKVDIESIRVQYFDGTFNTIKGEAALSKIDFPYSLDDVPTNDMMLD